METAKNTKSYEYGKCLETGKTTKSLEYGKRFCSFFLFLDTFRSQGILSFFLFPDTFRTWILSFFRFRGIFRYFCTFGLMLDQVLFEMSATGAKRGVRSLPVKILPCQLYPVGQRLFFKSTF